MPGFLGCPQGCLQLTTGLLLENKSYSHSLEIGKLGHLKKGPLRGKPLSLTELGMSEPGQIAQR